MQPILAGSMVQESWLLIVVHPHFPLLAHWAVASPLGSYGTTHCLEAAMADVVSLAAAVEVLHSASLVHVPWSSP